MKSRCEKRSPAKINLILKVLRKRSDGYHEIFSVMQAVSLFDLITIEAASGEGITVRCSDPNVPSDSSNLAHRAASIFLGRSGIKRRVDITIDKHIPVGAGLGGGSSNAATVLMGLNDMLSAGFGEKELMEAGSVLGSDVPFFMLSCPAVARGRGEILERMALPRYQYILINPGFKVSTAWAYSNLDLTKKTEDNILSYSGAYSEALLGDIDKLKGCLANDLELVTLPEHPELAVIKKALVDSGADGALMSGSGPTVFGVFRAGAAADAAFVELKERFAAKGYFIFRAEGL